MHLYDTRSRMARPFEAEGPIRMYVCGVTPYDTTHLGHARTYVVFDVLLRLLRRRGFQVRYVQNITDVDESILARAAEEGEPYRELGDRYTRLFLEDLAALNVLPPDHLPTASSAIPRIIDQVEVLRQAGLAYQVDGDIFFRVKAFQGYGDLSGLDREAMLAMAARQDDVDLDDPRKEDPLDFRLWRASRDDAPAWESPWGPGRPGWHIECSSLALDHLGCPLDIHGGGADLVFPHHESEIAQAEGAGCRPPFARFWVHAGLVGLAGEKMSKSAGNMVFVRDVLSRIGPDALRLYLLATHYRLELDHREGSLAEWARRAARLSSAARRPAVPDRAPSGDTEGLIVRFDERLNQDLDTPGAIVVLEELAEQAADGDGRAQRALRELGGVLGLELTGASVPQPT